MSRCEFSLDCVTLKKPYDDRSRTKSLSSFSKKDTYTHTASIASQGILKYNLTDLEDKKRRRFIHVNLNKSASFVMCLKFVQQQHNIDVTEFEDPQEKRELTLDKSPKSAPTSPTLFIFLQGLSCLVITKEKNLRFCQRQQHHQCHHQEDVRQPSHSNFGVRG